MESAVVKTAEVIKASEVVKASAAIQIENTISLFQRRAWTVLLANAYDELPSRDRHTIRVKDLMEILEYGSRNYQHLYDSLEALVDCKVKWNLLHRDKEWEWGVTTLLAEAKVKGGVCTYAFGPTLRERLYNPSMYARISLSLQNKFESKHALALWEVCLDYLDPAKNHGETPPITLEAFRQLMGIDPDTYPAFKIFNWRVIKEPIAEINDKTDFHITVDYQREGRKVATVKFRFRRILPLLAREAKQTALFFGQTDLPPLVEALQRAGIDLHGAWDIWQQGFGGVEALPRPQDVDFDTYVYEKLHLCEQQKPGIIKNPAGFIRQAIKYNWTHAGHKSKPKPVPRRSYTESTPRSSSPDLEAQQTTRCQELAQNDPDLLQEAINVVLASSAFQKQLYDATLSPLDNYHKRVSLAALVDRYFIENRPEYFADLQLPQVSV